MTWTYLLSDLATSEKDQIRLEIGDTDTNNQLLQDEEIAQAILVERNFWCAAARCCEMISRVFLAKFDVKLGRNMEITYSKAAAQYQAMAVAFRRKSLGTRVPWVGGMSVADKQTYSQNTDIVGAAFTRTMGENPWTGGYTPDSLGPAPTSEDDAYVEFP